eukprot:TRINITY_DN35742_c0_g1_i1.p1 TRINITY_DN35742_c0_g1~~TRINITY_DN35742_c0_g1_i1.p1  ORF type:complete len:320 (-),score=45.13 TRINITY_DN35742_c0_g1_i1:101-1027(-)
MAVIGRPVVRPLEVQVFEKFRRNDLRISEQLRKEYPHLIKPPPPIGHSGCGSVKWVGLNPDPCKAKFLEKQGLLSKSASAPTLPQRPASAPASRGPVETVELHEVLKECINDGEAETVEPQADKENIANASRPSSAGSVRNRPSSASATRNNRPSSAKYVRPSSSTGRLRPSSAPTGGRRSASMTSFGMTQQRDLSRISAAQHYLEQSMHLPGALPKEAFVQSGAWPQNGAVKPANLEELLYVGTSKDGGNGMGRRAYLRARNTLAPRQKVRFPVQMSQEIGWTHEKGTKANIILPTSGGPARSCCPC